VPGARRNVRRLANAGAAVLSLATVAAAATPQPLWELGLGIGALAFEDYRGADTGHVYPLPVPYFTYRGRFLRADRDGVRGLLLDRDFAELNLSVNATTPVRSGDTLARRGMPNLRPTVEIGPSLDWHLWRSADRHLRLDLGLPVRTAITVEATPHSIGWFFAPRLNLDVLDVGGHAGWNLGVLAGPQYANRRYDQYFYEVAPQYATAGRPAYQARGGYAGMQSLLALSKRYPGYWVGFFARYDALRGASFADSPLVRSNGYWLGGVAIAWMIGQSSQRVDVRDDPR
jgi:outer membrane protein